MKAGVSLAGLPATDRVRSAAAAFSVYDVAAAAVFVGILVVAARPTFDPDFWWHIFTGNHILNSGVPNHDFLSYTARGATWIDHEWLAELGMAALIRLDGFALVFQVFGLMVAGAFLACFVRMRSRAVHPVPGLVLLILGVVCTVATWGARVQMISLLFAGVFCLILDRYRSTLAEKWLIALVALMLLWSNLHGGFAVGLILIGCYLAGGVFDRVRGGMKWSEALRRQKALGVALLACIAATFLNPNTFHTALYPLRFISPNAFTNTIQESQSPNFHLFQNLPFELLLIGLIGSGLLVRSRISWTDLLLVLAFTHLALQQTRNVDLWVIVVLPIAAYYISEALTPLGDRFAKANREVSVARASVMNWALLLAIVVGGALGLTRLDATHAVVLAAHQDAPIGAVRFLEQHPPVGNGFNSYSYGGYLIWATDGSIPVFIDSRADTVYSDSLLQEYLAIYGAAPRWHQLLKEHSISWVFVEKTAPIAAVLSQADGWRRVYRGQESVIYEHH